MDEPARKRFRFCPAVPRYVVPNPVTSFPGRFASCSDSNVMAKRRTRRFDHRDDLLDAHVAVELDLHGHRAAEAGKVVESFITTQARVRSGKVVRVITGRGRNSSTGSVLRPVVRAVLQRLSGSHVREFDRDADEGSFLVRCAETGYLSLTLVNWMCRTTGLP